jgi:hypothetical protein
MFWFPLALSAERPTHERSGRIACFRRHFREAGSFCSWGATPSS